MIILTINEQTCCTVFANTCTTSSFGAFLGGGPLPFGASGAAANSRLNELLGLTLFCLQLSLTINFFDDDNDLDIFGVGI